MAAPPPRPAKTGSKPWLKGQTDDLASLANLDESILLEELNFRYNEDRIYTYVGDILVAVNPFKNINIYGSDHSNKYNDTVKSAAPPHIFAIADQAYFSLRRTAKNQCAIISGESGAGKTESAKYMIQQVIRLCHVGSEGAALERKIIQVNPLLEAFGNAKTVMNNNSSRFGKYTELKFNQRGVVVGAAISEYLLEKSRVVQQQAGERNFHMFYYVFQSPDAKSYGLTTIKDFQYISNPQVALGRDDHNAYKEVVTAMNEVGFSREEQYNIHGILASILHLGNINFDAIYSDHDPASMSAAPEVLQYIAKLLKVNDTELKEAMLVTVSYTRGEMIRKPYSCDQAKDCRDAFAKALYGRLFGWIVSQINVLLAPQGMEAHETKKLNEIGILDIFGFEHFQKNSFEQLCINVANEQLQHFFNEHIFAMELEEYRKEGIDGKNITYADNRPVLEMFLGRPIGMFALLDEESHFPKATDKTLVDKYKNSFGSHGSFEPRKTNDPFFSIKHYAGQVEYFAEGFLDKNRDSLAPDVVALLQGSENNIISDVFCGEISVTGSVVKGSSKNDKRSTAADRAASMSKVNKRTPTVGAQFTSSLKILMDKMNSSNAHFVRCIKPNTQQAASNFVPDFVNVQLRYTGMLETTRIRREGFSFRPSFADFMERFGILAYSPTSRIAPSTDTCNKVMKASGVQGWLMGKTKVFLKYWQVEQLDKQIRIFQDNAVVLQKIARGFIAKKRFKKLKAKSRQEAQQIFLFFDESLRNVDVSVHKLQSLGAQDAKRKASGVGFKPVANRAPPPPPKSEKELKREASVLWFKEKEAPKGAGQDKFGDFLPWFHGIISRQEAERLLEPCRVGGFLVRVSENRFGYTLSYRIEDRCRHYMVEQDTQGRYALVGIDKIASSLNELVEFFQRNQINAEGDMLRDPCGQEVDANGEEQCNYGELLAPGALQKKLASRTGGSGGNDAPPPLVSRSSKPGMPSPMTQQQQQQDAPPPPVPSKTRAAEPLPPPPASDNSQPPLPSRNSKPAMAPPPQEDAAPPVPKKKSGFGFFK